jgi:hypothetical protein
VPNSSIVRISGKAKETLEVLAKKSGESMLSVMDRAIEEYRRRLFLEETNRAYAKLRANKKASKEFDDEISAWDATLMDGLDASESWEDGKRKAPKQKGRRKQ